MNKTRLLIGSLLICVMAVSADAGLIVHLPLNGNLTDVAGGHTATLTDGFFGLNSYVPGTIGSGLQLINPRGSETSGSNWEIDYVAIDYTLTNDGSIALWFTPDALYDYHTVFANSANPDDWEMWVYKDGRGRARLESDSYVTKSGMVAGQTYHIAWTWDRDDGNPGQATVNLYVDGELVESDTGAWVNPGSTVYFGGGNSNHGSNAIFDDFRIYDHTLSAEEVAKLAIPEPASWILLALGGLFLFRFRRR